MFEEIIQLCLGGRSRSEAVGLSPVGLIVVDTDGSLEQVDTLRSAFPGASATGLNVFSHDFGAALAHPADGRQADRVGGPQSDLHRVCDPPICGGAIIRIATWPGRVSATRRVLPGPDKLIGHIWQRLAADVTPSAGQVEL